MKGNRKGKEEETALELAEMTFENWTRQKGETALAFSAFCAFRDFGPGRNIKQVLLSVYKDEGAANRKYRTWRNWAAQNHWYKRAGDYDSYLDKMRLTENRKLIEERVEAHKKVAAKMLTVISKKLDTMSPEEIKQANVPDWVKTSIETEREVLGIAEKKDGELEFGQFEIKFEKDFEGL